MYLVTFAIPQKLLARKPQSRFDRLFSLTKIQLELSCFQQRSDPHLGTHDCGQVAELIHLPG